MLKIDILDDNAAREALRKLGDGLPVALSAGLNRTMAAIDQIQQVEMERALDKPIPFTLNALKTWKAHPRHLDAGMFIQPLQAGYLKYAIEGGVVDSTITPVIGRAKLNDAGNIPSKKIKGAMGARGRKSAGSRGFFVGTPGNAKRIRAYGLWERVGRDRVRLIAKPEKGVKREKRWGYYSVAERVAGDRLQRDCIAAIARAVELGLE